MRYTTPAPAPTSNTASVDQAHDAQASSSLHGQLALADHGQQRLDRNRIKRE